MKKEIKEFIQHNRNDFRNAPFGKKDAANDPFKQFDIWFENTVKAEISDPFAMTLATANTQGIPSARVVYMRNITDQGLVFFTNYASHKGGDLFENPYACANFYWEDLSRQVRFTGRIEKVSTEESDAYFNSRPRESQLGAWASHQSEVLASRQELMDRVKKLEEKFAGQKVPRPEFWGGYALIATSVEFWQGRENRLHDRMRYSLLPDHSWILDRLSP